MFNITNNHGNGYITVKQLYNMPLQFVKSVLPYYNKIPEMINFKKKKDLLYLTVPWLQSVIAELKPLVSFIRRVKA